MKKLILLFSTLIFISSNASSALRVAKVFEDSEFKSDFTTIFLTNGEIVHLESTNTALIEKAKLALSTGDVVEITRGLDAANEPAELTSLEFVKASQEKEMYSPERFRSLNFRGNDPFEKHNMTTLSSYEKAQQVMDEFNGGTDDKSECYNRAHMWTYESIIKSKTTLGKIWIFFTNRYIREFRYKWWFHVSPMTSVGRAKTNYVLDRGFTMIPYTVENWKNIFIQNHARCPIITDYRSYENNQNSNYCYLIFSSQYYWQPWQIESLSKKGIHSFGYKMSELKITYPDALGRNWNRRIPELGNDNDTPDDDTGPGDTTSTSFARSLKLGETVLGLMVNDVVVSATVIKVRGNGSYLLKATQRNSPFDEMVFSRRNIAITEGCFQFCMGVNIRYMTQKAQIVGIQNDGRLVLRFPRFRYSLYRYNVRPQDI